MSGPETEQRGNLGQELLDKLFNPKYDELPGLTQIPRSQVLKIARMMTMDQAFNPERHEYNTISIPIYDPEDVDQLEPIDYREERVMIRYVTLSEIFLKCYFLLMRSVEGQMLGYGVMLAEGAVFEDTNTAQGWELG